jgi:hypothetical protein
LLMKQLGLDADGIQAAIEAKWVHI